MAKRIVQIWLAMKDGALPRSIKRVLRTVVGEETHTFVESQDEADLVIFTDVRDIEHGYSREKVYAFIDLGDGMGVSLPENCVRVNATHALLGLIRAIEMAQKNFAIPQSAVDSSEDVVLKPNALRILVIDDDPRNIASARQGLSGELLRTVTGYEEAMEILGHEKFDVVLTDLHLPMSSKTMGSKFVLGQLVPYGLLLMLEASRNGAGLVAVVTDLSHHDDPFSAAFDHFSQFSVKIETASVIMMHAPMKNGAKDWVAAFEQARRMIGVTK